MRIRWTPAAVADLEQINSYLTERLPNLRRSTMLRIHQLHSVSSANAE